MRVLQLSLQQTWPSGSPLTPVAEIIPLSAPGLHQFRDSWLNMKLPTYKENLVFFNFRSIYIEAIVLMAHVTHELSQQQ